MNHQKLENKPESNVQNTTKVRKLINDQDTVEFNLNRAKKEKSRTTQSYGSQCLSLFL